MPDFARYRERHGSRGAGPSSSGSLHPGAGPWSLRQSKPIAARSTRSPPLPEAVADTGRPVLLKRGTSATIGEWLPAAEYIAHRGNLGVVLCERGIRTYERATRNTLDLSAVPVAQQLSHLPVIVDPFARGRTCRSGGSARPRGYGRGGRRGDGRRPPGAGDGAVRRATGARRP
ncbi:hypothetical protein [Streptomyces sp. NBC_00388]|uniref:hypothetical protein n=1 Tax=Streptomyces sp. NBC_00388 TaxID=2975735 RepID=UPI002E1EE976